jgi:hypothetical protein
MFPEVSIVLITLETSNPFAASSPSRPAPVPPSKVPAPPVPEVEPIFEANKPRGVRLNLLYIG